jgi:hypothetical protein
VNSVQSLNFYIGSFKSFIVLNKKEELYHIIKLYYKYCIMKVDF